MIPVSISMAFRSRLLQNDATWDLGYAQAKVVAIDFPMQALHGVCRLLILLQPNVFCAAGHCLPLAHQALQLGV